MRLSARRRPGQAKEPGGAHTEFLLEVPSRRCETKLNEILHFGGRRRRSVELTLIGFTVFICVLSPELQECMDRNEGGAATSTRGRYETATPQR